MEPSSISALGIVLFVIYIVGFVLAVILFIKIWKACNDISKIASTYHSPEDPLTLRKLVILGKKEEAREIVISRLIDRTQNYIGDVEAEMTGKVHISSSRLQTLIDRAEADLESIGMPGLPSELETPSALMDFIGPENAILHL